MTVQSGGTRVRSQGGEMDGAGVVLSTANGALPASSSSSSSTGSGLFRHRNGSGILSSGLGQPASSLFERFRRPRTATNSSILRNADRQSVASPTDYVASSDELVGNRDTRNGGRMNGSSNRNGLPRSSSSSQVHLPFNNSSYNAENGNARRSGVTSHNASQSQGNIRFNGNKSSSQINGDGNAAQTKSGSSLGFPLLNRSGSSQGGLSAAGQGANAITGSSGGGGGFGRMFRRYSQGAGRNQSAANEAHAVAANSSGAAGRVDASTTQTDSNGSGGPEASQNDATNTGTAAHATTSADSGNSSTNVAAAEQVTSEPGPSTPDGSAQHQAHRIRLVPHLEATRSLHFEPIERDLSEGSMAVKIGRFTDRGHSTSVAATSLPASSSGARGTPSALLAEMTLASDANTTAGGPTPSAPTTSTAGVPGARGGAIPSATGGASRVDAGRIAFKSKVVSRGHAEIWCEGGGKVFIRDTKSSSGTFLNHIRLSAPNVESKPFQIKDGDVVQLGVDYQGGTEEIYRCVKMRIELNRGWQRGANQFNVNALRQLRALQGSPMPESSNTGVAATSRAATVEKEAALPTNRQNLNVTDCCICLFSVTVCQALFIAPCSHVFHYKCIRPLLNLHHPGFSCPLCRTFADLEAEVEEDEAWQQELLKEAEISNRPEIASTPLNEIPAPSLIAVALASSNSSDAEHYVDATAIINSAAPSIASHNNDRTAYHLGAPHTSASSRRESSASPTFARRASHSVDDGLTSGPAPTSSARRRSRQDVSLPGSSSRAGNEGLESPTPASRNESRRPSAAIGTGANAHRLTNTGSPDSSQSLHFVSDTGSPARTAIIDQGRRPSIPINIANANASPGHRAVAAHRNVSDVLSDSPGLSDARTPQNEHFLSTLAEAPPPTRSALRPL